MTSAVPSESNVGKSKIRESNYSACVWQYDVCVCVQSNEHGSLPNNEDLIIASWFAHKSSNDIASDLTVERRRVTWPCVGVHHHGNSR